MSRQRRAAMLNDIIRAAHVNHIATDTVFSRHPLLPGRILYRGTTVKGKRALMLLNDTFRYIQAIGMDKNGPHHDVRTLVKSCKRYNDLDSYIDTGRGGALRPLRYAAAGGMDAGCHKQLRHQDPSRKDNLALRAAAERQAVIALWLGVPDPADPGGSQLYIHVGMFVVSDWVDDASGPLRNLSVLLTPLPPWNPGPDLANRKDPRLHQRPWRRRLVTTPAVDA